MTTQLMQLMTRVPINERPNTDFLFVVLDKEEEVKGELKIGGLSCPCSSSFWTNSRLEELGGCFPCIVIIILQFCVVH